MKSSPESVTNTTPTPFGTPTARFPHGFPISGVHPAQLMASSYGGVLRVWFSRPGNKEGAFFLDDKEIGTGLDDGRWYFQSGLTSLGTIVIPLFQNTLVNLSLNIPVGTFMVYQARPGHTIGSPLLNTSGSYTFNGSSF
jgi:hypothetical protein